MADAVEALVRALAEALGEDADATAIADALWLAAAPTATSAAPQGDLPGPAPSDTAGDAPESPPDPDPDAPAPPQPAEDADATVLYESLSHTRPTPGASVAVPGGRDLPRALELRRALRPFKRRYPKGRRAELNLDATVRDFRRTGELTPVFTPAPEPWFELLLVVDTSPSMAVWQNTNAEFATLLSGLGAFRSLRTWSLRPGAAPVVTDHQGRRVAPGQAVSSDGRRLVLVLSDCMAPGWSRPETWQLLRGWGAKAPVALLNPLPDRLWHRTGLDLPAIRVGQRRPALRNADLTFHVPLLLRTLSDAEDADWQALPTLTFSPYSVARWAETFMRGSPHGYDAVLVPRTGVVPSLFRRPNAGRRDGPDLVEAFLRTASPSAVRLAVLCSPFGQLSLPLMHLIRQQLLPEASVGDLAELLTSPVVTIQTHEDAPPVVFFDQATRERLASRLSRRDAWLTYDALSRHIAARSPGGAEDIQAIAASEPDSVPPALYPFARASDELLTLLRDGAPVRPAASPGSSEASTPSGGPLPSRRLPDPARSTAVLIGVSRYGSSYSLPGVEAGLAAMRSYLTSPEGWNLSAERCMSLVNPRSGSEVLGAVTQACHATDTILLYFAGRARLDTAGRLRWMLSGDEHDQSWSLLEFDSIARILDESRPDHLMVISENNLHGAADALESWAPTGLTRHRARGTQVLSADGGPLTQEFLRVAAEGVPDGPEYLDLPTIAAHMNTESLLRTRFDYGDLPAPAFARNRACEPQDPVHVVYNQVRQHLESRCPHIYQGAYRRNADRFLFSLLVFTQRFIDGTEHADEATLVDAVQNFLGRRGIRMEQETPIGFSFVDLIWRSKAGVFAVHIRRDGPRDWRAVSAVDFELVLEREPREATFDLGDCVSTITDVPLESEESCLVVIRVPVPPRRAHDAEVTLDVAEREAMYPFPDEDELGRDALSAAVESACEQLLGESVEDPSAEETMRGAWTLNGVELPSGLTDLTIQAVTPDLDSIVWSTVEEYEYGLVLGHVTVNAELVLEGFMHKSDYSLAAGDVRLLEELNDHMVEVSVERNAQLTFDARQESEDIELEFSGTNAAGPHPHEPM
ncbi:SAV_2336 N-terminal domain-related protein [Streptomyces sp. NPDC001843]|uniref:SAV_2336 N-terminal domain-related protein n=1 Tax=Streptomyces sp. NPDC001843 TaxID=3364617 RepID=UPI0036D15C57